MQVGWDISTYPCPGVPNEGKGLEPYEQMLDRLMRRSGGQGKSPSAYERMLATYASGWNEYQAELVDMSQLWTVRDGRLVFFRVFRTKQAALQVAGAATAGGGPV